MCYFIIGATGYIGSTLYRSLRTTNQVVGTSRDYGIIEMPHYVRLDMSKDGLELLDDPFHMEKRKTAVICAAISSIKMCHEFYDYVYEINVVNTIKIISFLVNHGYYVIFLSSDNVFDGEKGCYREMDETNPINDYGRMKLLVEKEMRKFYSDVCVLRLSKVIGNNDYHRDILREWKDMAVTNGSIRCIKNNYFTPVFVGDIVRCVRILAEKKWGGYYI